MPNAVPATPPPSGEDAESKLRALDLLQQLGWTYLPPDEALRLRGGRRSEVILRDVLRERLARLNTFAYRGHARPFTDAAVDEAIASLAGRPDEGLVRTNEGVWDLLRLGKAVPQTVDGVRKSPTLRYVEWDPLKIGDNAFHVTEEFAVERTGSTATRVPDLVCFVNGIPFAVIECKPRVLGPSKQAPVEEAISQQLRNQQADEIPRLFHHAQLLLALAVGEARYGATGTPMRFWQAWREQPGPALARFRRVRPTAEVRRLREALARPGAGRVREAALDAYAASLAAPRELTAQDALLGALCRPERLLEIVRHFTLFDTGERKVARWQQYEAVHDIITRLRLVDPDGRRGGGVVWHTQGSGKSLTMVMLAEAILRTFASREPRVVLVTDRVDLDDQLYDTFRGVGVELEQAESGKDLKRLLADPRARVVTTLVHKFERALREREVLADTPDVFVLVDEGHRTQSGPLHAAMRIALPKAGYVGFTGTPILRGERATVRNFGGIIGRPYTIAQAVEDRAVVPLVYEGRDVPLDIDDEPIDRWFAKYTAALTEDQQADLARKYATAGQLGRAEQRVRAVAWDIGVHFRTNFQGTGLKGQLVAPSKADALLYKRFLDEFDMVTSEVLISAPDTREGHAEVDEPDDSANRPSVLDFWKRTLARYGSEDTYRKDVIARFKKADEPEIVIVVDMLLTGFDAPRNSVLYLCKPLREHTLLQAVARVNRVYDGKDYGLIVDYQGVLRELDAALDLYTDIGNGLGADDVLGGLRPVESELDALPQRHAAVWDTVKEVPNPADQEAMERLLADEERRARFYDAYAAFARLLKLAMASATFHTGTPRERVERYRHDLKFFGGLRQAVAQRYAESVDFRQYAKPIQKLLDTFVGAGEVETVVEPVSIFDRDAFKREVERFASPEAKAEVIRNRLSRTIHEHLDKEPIRYRKLSELLTDTYTRYRQGRIDEREYLRQMETLLRHTQNGTSADEGPPALAGRALARTYFDVMRDAVERAGADAGEDEEAALALEVDRIVEALRIVHWERNPDVQNRMRIEMEDTLFRFKERHAIPWTFADMDAIMENCLKAARQRSGGGPP